MQYVPRVLHFSVVHLWTSSVLCSLLKDAQTLSVTIKICILLCQPSDSQSGMSH